MDTLELVRAEIEDLHRFFVSWFHGSIGRQYIEAGFDSRMAEEFVFIGTRGIVRDRTSIRESLLRAHGANTELHIVTRNVQIHVDVSDLVLATYEELQYGARLRDPDTNLRTSTVLFHRDPEGPRGLVWRHLQETARTLRPGDQRE